MNKLKNSANPTVYSTEVGRICPGCGKAVAACNCKEHKSYRINDGIVRLRLETKGRKGKGVTVISGVPLDQSGMNILVSELKKRCGSGGTLKDGNIEVQGDHRELLFDEMKKRGWQVKQCGG